ncbi:MAG: hypothetical protein Tsb0021_15550 [Chlamydiales bacterium]
MEKPDDFIRNWRHLKPLLFLTYDKLREEDFVEEPSRVVDLIALIKSRYPKETERSILQEIKSLDDQILFYE